ncbi:TIGR03086 family metal-binding protein [Nocardioides iriomotensis]|nr:TIGR03086 family metal-binding protein [Nocardioides iriomotensis]
MSPGRGAGLNHMDNEHPTLPFGPATATLARVVTGVRDDQLAGPTPCPDWTVADLVDHIAGLTLAFTAAATKTDLPGGAGPRANGSDLPDGWRERIGADLAVLAEAWAKQDAYEGTTMAGPVEMPGDAAGLVALDEVVVHGWDLARATGQPYDADLAAVEAVTRFVASFEPPDGGTPDADTGGGLFGPPVAVPAHAHPVDRLAGLTGRDPGWRATS